MSIETGKLREDALHQPEKVSKKKLENFIQNILPGIYDRTKQSGHFRDMKTQDLIQHSEMSDSISEDARMYEEFVKKLEHMLVRTEKSPHMIGESDVRDIHRMFAHYGEGRESGTTHYFVEYLKNKSGILAAACDLFLDRHISRERFAQEIQKILLECTGKMSRSKKKSSAV